MLEQPHILLVMRGQKLNSIFEAHSQQWPIQRGWPQCFWSNLCLATLAHCWLMFSCQPTFPGLFPLGSFSRHSSPRLYCCMGLQLNTAHLCSLSSSFCKAFLPSSRSKLLSKIKRYTQSIPSYQFPQAMSNQVLQENTLRQCQMFYWNEVNKIHISFPSSSKQVVLSLKEIRLVRQTCLFFSNSFWLLITSICPVIRSTTAMGLRSNRSVILWIPLPAPLVGWNHIC